MIQAESRSPDANIKTGGDALWWSMVTITTVGYGDKYPVTEARSDSSAIVVMFSGIGIIGALASILASLLVSPSPPAAEESAQGSDAAPPADAAASPMASGRSVDA